MGRADRRRRWAGLLRAFNATIVSAKVHYSTTSSPGPSGVRSAPPTTLRVVPPPRSAGGAEVPEQSVHGCDLCPRSARVRLACPSESHSVSTAFDGLDRAAADDGGAGGSGARRKLLLAVGATSGLWLL